MSPRFFINLLILLCFFTAVGAEYASADTKKWTNQWSKRHQSYVKGTKYQPYLEEQRHVQIPQWDHKEWYAEDWFAQKDSDSLIRGFYEADILWDQTTQKPKKDEEGYPILVVGPNFYRLSGYDKRRVSYVVDRAHNITDSKKDGFFMLHDWQTKMPIGVFDKNGLRLH